MGKMCVIYIRPVHILLFTGNEIYVYVNCFFKIILLLNPTLALRQTDREMNGWVGRWMDRQTL